MVLSAAISILSTVSRATSGMLGLYSVTRISAVLLSGILLTLIYRGSGTDVYNILWAVVFGFATLNILSLAAKRTETGRRGFTFGEMMAVMIVLLSIFLLAVEMFNMLHIFPIKLRR